jgi:hypothetical protein
LPGGRERFGVRRGFEVACHWRTRSLVFWPICLSLLAPLLGAGLFCPGIRGWRSPTRATPGYFLTRLQRARRGARRRQPGNFACN